MKRDDVLTAYNTLVQMKGLADKLDEAINNREFDKASQIKLKILELQRGLKKII